VDAIGIVNEYLNSPSSTTRWRSFVLSRSHSMIGMAFNALYEPATFERFTSRFSRSCVSAGGWPRSPGLRHDGLTFPQEIRSVHPGGGLVCVVPTSPSARMPRNRSRSGISRSLSGFAESASLQDRLTVSISHAQRDRTKLAVLSSISIAQSHQRLRGTQHRRSAPAGGCRARCSRACVKATTVARWAVTNSQFCSRICPTARTPRRRAEIIDAVRYPFHIEGREFFHDDQHRHQSLSHDGVDAESLIKNADTAMYQAKEQDRQLPLSTHSSMPRRCRGSLSNTACGSARDESWQFSTSRCRFRTAGSAAWKRSSVEPSTLA